MINNKTDAADACAICEVVRRPNTSFVQIKTVEQQQITALHRVRERLIRNRTALVNQIRGLLYEDGIIIQQGITFLRREFPEILCENDYRLSCASKILYGNLYEELCIVDDRIAILEKQLQQMARTNENCTRLLKVPGIGLLTATALVAHIGDAKQFKNSRQFSACLGLTPKEYSSGGKQKLLGISKRGNSYLRKLLIQGARILCTWWNRKTPQKGEWRKLWLQQITERRGKFVAAVAQANKTARIVWHILAKGEEYQSNIVIV